MAPLGWPFQCAGCRTEHYCSPKPVVVLVLQAWAESHKRGIVVIRRANEPFKGELAFPGGYLDHKEDWRLAATRELQEELGISLDPRHFQLRAVHTTNRNILVMFAQHNGDVLSTKDFKPSPAEVQEVLVLDAQDQKHISLGIPIHDTVWKALHLL